MTRLQARGLRNDGVGPIDFALARGECLAVMGPSGAGKTRLLRMLADLDVHRGELLLDGRPRETWTAPAWRRQVCYCAAETGWWEDTPIEHFEPAQRALLPDLLTALGLDAALLDSPVTRLSTGEKQRLALARALVLEPPVLLLDEPTGALDEASEQDVERVLKQQLSGGVSIIIVTHKRAQAARLARQTLQIGAAEPAR